MKLTNLLLMPVALVADAVTLGEAGITRKIFRDERDDKEIEALKTIAEILKAQSK